ncbi:MAG: hypothetical protein K2G60_06495, partial [Oscillospiraceae bacterium]|nr:hypothetical protein [Oscillospiraceae bacterium]
FLIFVGLFAIGVGIALRTFVIYKKLKNEQDMPIYKKMAVLGIVVGFIVFVFGNCFVIVPTGHTGVRTTFGQVSQHTVGKGLNFKVPFVQSIELVNNKQQDVNVDTEVWGETIEKTPVFAKETIITYQINSEKSAWKRDNTGFQHIMNGNVIGEFMCNDVDKVVHVGTRKSDIELCFSDNGRIYTPLIAEFYRKSCFTYAELEKYSNGSDIYGWHIVDLKIYDKPKELNNFYIPCKGTGTEKDRLCVSCSHLLFDNDSLNGYVRWCGVYKRKPLVRPPKSYCYVREKE